MKSDWVVNMVCGGNVGLRTGRFRESSLGVPGLGVPGLGVPGLGVPGLGVRRLETRGCGGFRLCHQDAGKRNLPW